MEYHFVSRLVHSMNQHTPPLGQHIMALTGNGCAFSLYTEQCKLIIIAFSEIYRQLVDQRPVVQGSK